MAFIHKESSAVLNDGAGCLGAPRDCTEGVRQNTLLRTCSYTLSQTHLRPGHSYRTCPGAEIPDRKQRKRPRISPRP